MGTPVFVEIGKKYNKLTTIKSLGINPKNKNFYYLCVCDCGKEVSVKASRLANLSSKSCGCQKGGYSNTTHNMSNSRLYSIWTNMKRRCCDKKHKSYPRYGGRGISVCNEWLSSFDAFHKWAIGSGYEEWLSIDRVKVNGNYKPSNCKWSTNKEQSNNMTNNFMITYNGATKTLMQWSDELRIPYTTLYSRFVRGYSIKDVFTKKIARSQPRQKQLSFNN